MAWGGAIGFGIAATLFSLDVLQRFPNSADEFAFLFQARLFAEGKIWMPAHPLQAVFSPFFIIQHENKVFSLFPPGWPALLAAGVKVGVPFCINPILGAASLVVLYHLARHLTGKGGGGIAMGLLAFSPTYLFNSASWFSHPFCLFCMVTSLYYFVRLGSDNAEWRLSLWAAGAGMFCAMAFATRELSAVCLLLLPLGYTAYRLRSRPAWMAWFGAGALPILLVYGWYCHQVTGTWFMPPRFLAPGESLGFGWREIHVWDYVERQYFGPREALVFTIHHLGRLLLWTFPALPLLALAGVIHGWKDPWMKIFFFSTLLQIAGYGFYPSAGGNQYGPRFYYESLPCLCLLATRTVLRWKPCFSTRSLVTAAALLLMFDLSLTTEFSQRVAEQIGQRRTLYRLVERRELNHALVFVGAPSGDMTQGDLIRNEPGWENAPVIYVWDLGERNREARKAFPARAAYRFGVNPETGAAYLESLTPE